MYKKQANTRPVSSLPVVAAEDLTGMDGRLGVLSNNSGVLEVGLPAAITDATPVIILDEGEAGDSVPVSPLDGSLVTRRIVLKGACSPGERLVMADPSTAADAGKIRALPAAAATYLQVGVALEAGADGQWLEFLPVNVGAAIVVS